MITNRQWQLWIQRVGETLHNVYGIDIYDVELDYWSMFDQNMTTSDAVTLALVTVSE
jgi:hypothetical protein